jgi:hypothetical protein
MTTSIIVARRYSKHCNHVPILDPGTAASWENSAGLDADCYALVADLVNLLLDRDVYILCLVNESNVRCLLA